ncbi:MAG: S41 family peptidase [Acidobacteriota bacterium]
MFRFSVFSALSRSLLLTAFLFTGVFSQVNSTERGMAIGMLDSTKDAIKKNYYDPTFHGVDLDFVFEQAKERMKVAPTRDALMVTIASAVLSLDDSHTNFFPPARAAEIDYGWVVDMVGDDCFVTHVKPGSDAEAKGLKPGDRLVSIDGFKPTRQKMWQMYYRYFAIAPVGKVSMMLFSPGDEKPHVLEIQTKIEKTPGYVNLETLYTRGVVRHGWYDNEKIDEFEQIGDVLIWKMHTFEDTDSNIDSAMAKAKKSKSLILDLRDNGGGYVDILKRLLGHFFDKDIKIGDQKMRKETKPLIAKSRGGDVFKGNLYVVVNHDSGSASEIFSRVIQLEGRGKIIGDRSAGAVMESKFYSMDSGIGNNLYFGASVTMADVIMADGKSLEKVGVTPDQMMLPTGKDIAEKKDPVLAAVAKLCGVNLSAEKAGTLFAYKWPKP